MTPNPELIGYLEQDYLENPHLGGTALFATAMQVELKVVDQLKFLGMQVERRIVDHLKFLGLQVEMIVETDDATGMQVNRISSISDPTGMQVELSVADFNKYIGSQVDLTVSGNGFLGSQALQNIVDFARASGMQVNRQVLDISAFAGSEIRLDKSWPHRNCAEAGYLNQEYLSQTYLGNYFCVHGPMQVLLEIEAEHVTGCQVELNIVDHVHEIGMQIELNIADHPSFVGMQVDKLRGQSFAAQVLRVLYNTTNLRILCEFPSRGLSGVNWSATSTAAGDFSVNNLNTDIVEQVWRSQNGTTSVLLTCDTEVPQGILVDTMAILNHNLTSSATISFEGANNGAFSPVGVTIPITATEDDIYYIAPVFPTSQYRYWRLVINDVTNPESRLQIGTVVFGTTVILQGECFVDELVRRTRHFSDKVMTEGFTNVSNDRAIKFSTQLEFRNIQYGLGNFKNLKDVFQMARTSLKCLWIPDPRDPPRFAVFGKLTQIPEERHKNMGPDASDNVDFSVEVDESL